jgi:hypothetical protein
VVVRRPSNVVFFVANNTVELRLFELTDVELEVSHAGQTVNRLVLKTEFQAARTRMLSGIRQNRAQATKTEGIKDAGSPPSSMLALEREMQGIRGDIQDLVDHVATLAEASKRAGVEHHGEPWPFIWVLAAMLGGLLATGLASLLTGYAMWHRGTAYVQALERVRDALPNARPGLPAAPPARLAALERGVPWAPSTARARHVRVLYKASRRVSLKRSHGQETPAHFRPLPRASVITPDAPQELPEPTDLERMRANLWQELISAQKRDLEG